MPNPRKPTPERYCQQCGAKLERKPFSGGRLEDLGVFNRRKFCNMACMGANFDARPVKSDPCWATAHHHARKAKPKGNCSKCGSDKNVDVHHIDGNWRNNAFENLERLCRSCHNIEHRPVSSCIICGGKVKGYGFCEMHYQRFKKWGNPLIIAGQIKNKLTQQEQTWFQSNV